MLKAVRFKNFRCFENSDIKFKELTVIVGKNNAGKSSVVEALRMIATAGSKATSTQYTSPPLSLGLPWSTKGFKINVEKLKIDLRTAVHFYQEGTALIQATFRNETRIDIHINKELAFACLYSPNGEEISSRVKAKEYKFDLMGILPQIGLIKENEELLTQERVVTDKDTYRSSRHFRNELLHHRDEYFDSFRELAEQTWQSLRIRDLEYDPNESKYITLLVEDAGFTAELGLMGSGLQMWLQIIWFLCRSQKCDTVILDEPDVYMHPDLQRDLIKYIEHTFPQVIIATHSVEIISEVEPNNIVVIDKDLRTMKYANSKKSVQTIIDSLGSVHNLSLLRISTAKKCIFLEGGDMSILSKIHSILFPNSGLSFNRLPVFELKGGWSRLNEAYGVAKLFFSETEDSIKCYCIIDRDYHSQEEIKVEIEKANSAHLLLHIWERKEIENYLLCPSVLYRVAKTKMPEEDFYQKLDYLVDTFKNFTITQYAQQIQSKNRGKELSTCMKEAEQYVAGRWLSLDEKLGLIPGKDFLSKVNQWMKDDFNSSCTQSIILKNMKPEEIDDELKVLISEIIR